MASTIDGIPRWGGRQAAKKGALDVIVGVFAERRVA